MPAQSPSFLSAATEISPASLPLARSPLGDSVSGQFITEEGRQLAGHPHLSLHNQDVRSQIDGADQRRPGKGWGASVMPAPPLSRYSVWEQRR